ncbi:MAG: hypothetical protein ACUVRJ_02635 [Candidatus Villigracilaceae bacterium]
MNRLVSSLGYEVLATDHNLDDEAAVLFGNTLAWSGDHLRRQGLVLPAGPGLARKVKPCAVFVSAKWPPMLCCVALPR